MCFLIIFHVHPFTKPKAIVDWGVAQPTRTQPKKAPGLELHGGRSGRSDLARRLDSINLHINLYIYILHIVNVEFLNLYVNSFYKYIHNYIMFNIFLKVSTVHNTVMHMCTYTYCHIVSDSYRHTYASHNSD